MEPDVPKHHWSCANQGVIGTEEQLSSHAMTKHHVPTKRPVKKMKTGFTGQRDPKKVGTFLKGPRQEGNRRVDTVAWPT